MLQSLMIRLETTEDGSFYLLNTCRTPLGSLNSFYPFFRLQNDIDNNNLHCSFANDTMPILP